MHIPISQRLLACAAFVNPGDRVADVGCDHGYLGIYLLERNIARSVIAADLREGPLQSARDNARVYGTEQKMEFILSDGVQALPRDFDTMVCAGMGAETMISILEGAPWLRDSRYRLILQCQFKSHLLRRYLSETGFELREERVLRDGRFLYTVMEVCWNPRAQTLTPGQWYIPSVMAQAPDPDFPEYFRWIRQELQKIVDSRGENVPDWMAAAALELQAQAEQMERNTL